VTIDEQPGVTGTPGARSLRPQDNPLVVSALEEYLAALEAGQAPDRSEFLARHAVIADGLADCLDGLDFIRSAASRVREASQNVAVSPTSAAQLQPEAPLGDYRIVREVGRGGMGVVYEAVQISLGRRVALKVLPFAAALDPKQLQRFKNEAQAAAHLHHQNIVPVYGVGTERGVHFYAMQFIAGQTLAAIIQDLRQREKTQNKATANPGVSQIADELLTGNFAPGRRAAPDGPPTGPYVPAPSPPEPGRPLPAADTAPHGGLSTERSTRNAAYFRTVAHLGRQAAEALEHAHQLGVIHRDIKPANLLVDAGGQLWVTDFGLARFQDNLGLTMTGDLLGTLRYMSPEQALAKRVVIDHRTDIYSLGATLYELVTLQPAFPGRDRQELLRKIAFEEPRPPRRLNGAVPAELETIILKAMGKNPEERYATARDLVDDLGRYLEDKPIRAKPPTLLQRTRKWARRHQSIVVTALVALFVGLIFAVVGLAISNQLITAEEKRTTSANEQLKLQLYAQTIGRAEREYGAGNVGRAEQLLDGPECQPDLQPGWEWHYLKRLRYGGVAPIQLPSFVWCLALSPDGRLLALGGMDGLLELRQTKALSETRRLNAGTECVRGVAFSPDGRRLAVGYANGSITVREIAGDRVVATLAQGEEVHSIAFSQDGSKLISAGLPPIKVWDAATWEELPGPKTGRDYINTLALSPDGERLAGGGDERTVRIWQTATWRELRRLPSHVGAVRVVAFSPDGRQIAAALGNSFYSGDECAIQVWDASTGQEIHTLRGHQAGVRSLAFSPDGRRLATAGMEDATIKIWDMVHGLEVLTLRGHADAPMALAFSLDGRVLYSTGADHTLRVWDGTPLEDDSGSALRTFAGHTARVAAVAFAPDDHRLVSAGFDPAIRVWDVTTGKELHRVVEHPGPVQSLAFSPRGHLLASTSCSSAEGPVSGLLKIWDSRTWHELYCSNLNFGGFVSAAFSQDGKRLVTGGEESVVVWDATSYQSSPVGYSNLATLTSVAVSPEGTRAASADINGEVKIWNLDDYQPVLAALSAPPLANALVNLTASLTAWPVQKLRAHSSRVTGVAFSPARDLLATCGMDGQTCLWDARTFKSVAVLPGHGSGVRCLAFSPEGSRLATGGNDATIRVWDMATHRELLVLHGHTDVVYSVTFSHDGRYIASGSRDRTAKIWDAQGSAEQHACAAAEEQDRLAVLRTPIPTHNRLRIPRPFTGGHP
jgi:WD40 repeat protein/serine/threonine protein kinase